MWTVLAVCFVVVVSVVGITELLRRFWLYIMRPKGDLPRVMVVFLKEDIAVQQLRSAIEHLSWESTNSFCAVAAIDCGMDEETKKAVKRIADNRSDVIFGETALSDCLNSFKAVDWEA